MLKITLTEINKVVNNTYIVTYVLHIFAAQAKSREIQNMHLL